MKIRLGLTKTINLGLLGIAKKAGFIAAGEETVTLAVREGKARLVLTASDLSEGSLRRIRESAEKKAVPCLDAGESKSSLGASLGRGDTGILAITDVGIAASIAAGIRDMGPEYEAAADTLSAKAERTLRRRNSSKANGSRGKKDRRRTTHRV